MKKSISCLLLLVACTALYLQAQQPVSFFEEHIDFVLDSVCFSINGIYSFHNASKLQVNEHIVFPFADKTSGIDSIRIVNLNTLKKVPFTRLESSVSFEFSLLPNDTVDLNIFYSQKAAIKNTYIITSTQTWGKPLETAVYSLTTPTDLLIKSLSYTPDSIAEDHGKRVFMWERHQFMPVRDFEIVVGK
ncbi:MAG: hypothetical protein PHT07_17780 [Paludibacter sp.]|nr:hypothetical protein [Paludibacter sp.]